jgi:hypothetical protein
MIAQSLDATMTNESGEMDVEQYNLSFLESLPLDDMNVVLSFLSFDEFQILSMLSKKLNESLLCSSHLYMTERCLSSYVTKRLRTTGSPPGQVVQDQQTHAQRQLRLSRNTANHLSPDDLRHLLGRYHCLNVLHLQGLAAVGDHIVSILNESPAASKLTKISLQGCSLSYWCNQSLALVNLQHVIISGGSIRTRFCSLLKNSLQLRSLSISQCSSLRDESVATLQQEKLQHLTLRQCERLKRPVLRFSRLTHLNLVGCYGLTDLPGFDCPSVRDLDLSFCVRLSGEIVEQIVLRLPHLEKLVMVKCPGVQQFRLSSKSLQVLNMSFCSSLQELRLHCPNLQALEVSEGVHRVSVEFELRLNDPHL